MNNEIVKKEFIKLKMEELNYIDSIATLSINKILSEREKIEIYRNLKNYEIKLNDILKILCDQEVDKFLEENKKLKKTELKNVIIVEFDIDRNFLSSVQFNYDAQKEYILKQLGIDIEAFKFKLTLANAIHYLKGSYRAIEPYIIQNNQQLIETPIYIFCGYYDYSEDCYGPCSKDHDDYLYGIYENMCSKYNDKKEIQKKEMNNFEKDQIILRSTRYVHCSEIRKIFEEEILNIKNNTLADCIIQTKNRIEELNYIRSPEYKEKILLERINELYQKVKGAFIKQEILYNGNFLNILKETYQLPNDKIVEKEKVIKNSGKNSVIIIAITKDKEYIITFQNRINNKIIAEFPSGYIEDNEDPIEAAIRELKEETGYISDDLFIVDESYTSPGIDNSITYIIVANNCIKTNDIKTNGTELINYGLFSQVELQYLIYKNIMNGTMNKLAYYNLINNVSGCNITYLKNNKKIYKKTNPLVS